MTRAEAVLNGDNQSFSSQTVTDSQPTNSSVCLMVCWRALSGSTTSTLDKDTPQYPSISVFQ